MSDKKLKEKIQKITMALRKNVKLTPYTENDIKNCIMTEVRQGYINGKVVDRLIIFLRGTGCYLTRKQGGCTFCGFYNATNYNNQIPDEFFLIQVKNVLTKLGDSIKKYPIVCLYNDGSLLCEDEISCSVVSKIFDIFEQIPTVKKLVIESRVDDVSGKRIKQLRNVYHKKLEIAVGFESCNEEVRELCMNKYFSNKNFENAVKLCRDYQIDIIPLMILKPIFLTENEAIQDYVESLKYLEQFNLSRIDMEIMTIEKNTLTYLLWKQGYYQLPNLWSVIEILRQREELNLQTRVYISPMHYSVEAERSSSNCNKCSNIIVEQFSQYNICGKVEVFDNIFCNCKEDWYARVNEKPIVNDLRKRIEYVLKNINYVYD